MWYKRNGDARVVKNKTIMTKHSLIGFDTKDKAPYNSLSANIECNYIICTNHNNILEKKYVEGTLRISQVGGYDQTDALSGQWYLLTPFSHVWVGAICRPDPSSFAKCSFFENRKAKV